ncbi:uncharacterized protein LOC129600385 [Paramacrobiotus metropolitanus]|uniref:uncharacterized protein LOC129600385 n=1 Tax=Paramacrobiotus metropolitanus TaxID=2943436 RepID=UPI002446380E|nr:uncharacterized protein LOC129600385 [Paramacrobiotus metropolitanus]
MCRIIDKRRLDLYFSPQYQFAPLYKKGDLLWTFCKPPNIDQWLVYEAKVLCVRSLRLRCDDLDEGAAGVKRTVQFPVYDVRYAWKSQKSGKFYQETVDEKHLYDRHTMTDEEVFCIVGLHNQNVLSRMPVEKRVEVPGEGLVFLGRDYVKKLETRLIENGVLAQHEAEEESDEWHFGWTTPGASDNSASETTDSDDEWRGDRPRRSRKRKRRISPKQPLPSDKPIISCSKTAASTTGSAHPDPSDVAASSSSAS